MTSERFFGDTILLVEDNPDDEELILRSFRKAHLANDVVVARDGIEALDYLFCRGKHLGRDPKDLPRLVLLDIKLPKMNGMDVLKEIRANQETKLLPVVILTSSDEERDLLQSYENGANGFVNKPVGFEEFNETVKSLSLYWLLVNRPPGKASE